MKRVPFFPLLTIAAGFAMFFSQNWVTASYARFLFLVLLSPAPMAIYTFIKVYKHEGYPPMTFWGSFLIIIGITIIMDVTASTGYLNNQSWRTQVIIIAAVGQIVVVHTGFF